MAPFPHEVDGGDNEVMELQHASHYNPNVASLQPISIFETLNSVLHRGTPRSTDASNNGSHSGSSSGILNTTPGEEELEEESDLAVLLALFIPLAATVTAIFIIAIFVRRMRRAESLHEVLQRNSGTSHKKNEFEMATRKKTGASGSSVSSTTSSASSTASNNHRSPLSYSKSHSKLNHLDSSSSSGSIYRNSSYLRLAPHLHHLQLQQTTSLPVAGVNNSPQGSQQPPWPLAAESLYTRSQYGLNKLHQQLYQQASLQAFASVQNLNTANLTRQYSDPHSYCSQSDPEVEISSDEGSHTSSKKSTGKKFKRVLNAINFPRKIRQYQADKKRFNIYTVPVETREQLKHIYVY